MMEWDNEIVMTIKLDDTGPTSQEFLCNVEELVFRVVCHGWIFHLSEVSSNLLLPKDRNSRRRNTNDSNSQTIYTDPLLDK